MDISIKENIRESFLLAAINHGQAVAIGDYKSANKLHKKLQKIYEDAKSKLFVDVFSEFLEHNDENVRMWAASFSLYYSPIASELTLSKLTQLNTITGLTAKTILNLWKTDKSAFL